MYITTLNFSFEYPLERIEANARWLSHLGGGFTVAVPANAGFVWLLLDPSGKHRCIRWLAVIVMHS